MTRARSLVVTTALTGSLVAGAWGTMLSAEASAATPAITVTPVQAGAPAGPFQDGETLRIEVAANAFFQPNSRVNIYECADPGGAAANLPVNDLPCDGRTIQGDTVHVQADGSISYANYTVYRLPSTTLGEQANSTPVCDQTHVCVLYVGENQNDFTAPKVFSAPFTVAGTSVASSADAGTATGAASPAAGASLTPTPPTTSGGGSDATSLAQSGVLAQTGVPPAVPWLVALGSLLVAVGAAGRTRLRGM